MTRPLLIFLLAFYACLATRAQIPVGQQGYADSVQHLLSGAENDSIKARYYLLLSDHWSYSDSLKSIHYLDSSLQVAGDNAYIRALSMYYKGGAYFDTDMEKSKAAYMKSDTLLQKFHTEEAYYFRSKAWRNYGVLHQIADDDSTYIHALLDHAIPLIRQSGSYRYQEGMCYQDLGLLFCNAHQYDKAAGYYLQSIDLLKQKPGNEPAISLAYFMAARCYVFSGKPREAKPLLDQAFKGLKTTSSKTNLPGYYLSEGVYHKEMHQYSQAEHSFNQGIAIARQLQSHYEEMELIFQKYRVLRDQKQYAKAVTLLTNVLNDPKAGVRDDNRVLIYYELSNTYEALGNTAQAYAYMRSYATLKDSISNQDFKTKINELEAKYRLSENRQKIASLEAQQARNALAANNTRIYNGLLIIACFVLLIISVFIGIYYRNNKKLSQQKEINYRQELKELRQQEQLTATRAILQGEERERKRIARDLHDGLGGMLSGVKINLSGWANKNINTGSRAGLEEVLGQLDGSVNELRRISRNMMPETLLKFGLETALRDLCAFYTGEDVQVTFQAINIPADIPQDVQMHIYRMIQELIANAIRHGAARHILVQCSQQDRRFLITVEDDGTGFDPEIQNQKKGLGLLNIHNRVEYLGGQIDIQSQQDQGSSFNIELPLEEVK